MWTNEFVGWTVLDGMKSSFATGDTVDARGDTIVNYKVGLRYSFGQHSIAGSYGVALTDDVWYENIIRTQYDYVW